MFHAYPMAWSGIAQPCSLRPDRTDRHLWKVQRGAVRAGLRRHGRQQPEAHNVKSLVVKNSSEQPRTLRIDRHQRGVIAAANIITDEAVQIVNPEHIIATLTDDVPFVMELTVENGRGYRTADENAGREREIGVIPVDSSFSPVVRVKYDIEETRVGQRLNYDKLVMEIWTNGTVTPQMAVRSGHELPGIGRDYHRSRPGHPHGRGAIGSAQFWRDDAEGSEGQARRARVVFGNETAGVTQTIIRDI